jgi:hypothetical protein
MFHLQISFTKLKENVDDNSNILYVKGHTLRTIAYK